MLTTINDLVFPVFLLAVYFCAASVILYNPKQQHQSSQDIVVSEPESSLEDEVTAHNNSQESLPSSPVKFSPIKALGGSDPKVVERLKALPVVRYSRV
jgi:hypothetical protein